MLCGGCDDARAMVGRERRLQGEDSVEIDCCHEIFLKSVERRNRWDGLCSAADTKDARSWLSFGRADGDGEATGEERAEVSFDGELLTATPSYAATHEGLRCWPTLSFLRRRTCSSPIDAQGHLCRPPEGMKDEGAWRMPGEGLNRHGEEHAESQAHEGEHSF